MGSDWLGNLAEETLVSNKREVPLFWSSNGGCGGWRMLLELADLSDEPSPHFTPAGPAFFSGFQLRCYHPLSGLPTAPVP